MLRWLKPSKQKNYNEENKSREKIIYNIIKDHPEKDRLINGVPRFPYVEESLEVLLSLYERYGENTILNLLEATSSYSCEEDKEKREILLMNYSLAYLYSNSQKVPELLAKYNNIVKHRSEKGKGHIGEKGKASKETSMSVELEKINNCVDELSLNSKKIDDIIGLCEIIDDAQQLKHEFDRYYDFLNNLEITLTNVSEYSSEIIKTLKRYGEEERFIIGEIIKRKTEDVRKKDGKIRKANPNITTSRKGLRLIDNDDFFALLEEKERYRQMTPMERLFYSLKNNIKVEKTSLIAREKKRQLVFNYIKSAIREFVAYENNKIELKNLLYTLRADSIFNTKETFNNEDRLVYLRNIGEIAYVLGQRKPIKEISETAKQYKGRELDVFMNGIKEIAQRTKNPSLVEKIAMDCRGKKGSDLRRYMEEAKIYLHKLYYNE